MADAERAWPEGCAPGARGGAEEEKERDEGEAEAGARAGKPEAAGAEAHEVVGRRAMRRIALRILPTMFVISFLASIDTQFLAFAAPSIEEDLGMSETQYGMLITSTFIANTLFMYPAAVFSKRASLRVYLIITFVVQGVLLACTVLVDDFASLVAVRTLGGGVMSGVYPATMAYVADFWSKEAFGTAWARSWNVGLPTGTLVGGPIAAAILRSTGGGGVASWKWVFVVEALLVFAVLVPASLFLPSSPADCGSFLSAEQQVRRRRRRHGGVQGGRRPPCERLGARLVDRHLSFICGKLGFGLRRLRCFSREAMASRWLHSGDE